MNESPYKDLIAYSEGQRAYLENPEMINPYSREGAGVQSWAAWRAGYAATHLAKLSQQAEALYHPSKPMICIELAARSVLEKFHLEWPKIEKDFTGCTLNISITEDKQFAHWLVKGMPPEKAQIYNDRYAKTFGNALIGVLNIQTVKLEFEEKEAS